ncbi:MAG: tetraacyldisaccharide 4'-kinase [Candidatus Accumulibacter sp.]|jgi:tetraacyldisaccharide 4'-kinase|nr:tetraacyldisaccharide 4'-kinase [Accumulibacter sp.]
MKRFFKTLPALWFRAGFAPALIPLLPFSWLFRGAVFIRRFLYRHALLPSVTLPVPVIVVGNLTVGGTGKTPLALWLVEHLKEAGRRPGIISRGYGAAGASGVFEVLPDSPAALAGDEPLLLARRSGVPVFVGRDRAAAGVRLLNKHPECDVLVSDDGMQHYRIGRLVEIAVFDARGAGNRRLLPAGPLREPLSRLPELTALVWNSCPAEMMPPSVPVFSMRLMGDEFYRLDDASVRRSAAGLRGGPFYAVAGMGDPSRFFRHLESLGLEFEAHPFPDHHVYSAEDFAFAREGAVLMTEKDAVKCAGLTPRETWVLPVEARIAPAVGGRSLFDVLLEKLNGSSIA